MLKIGGYVEEAPAITKWDFEDLGDDPLNHRWRAWWSGGGIELHAYPVLKVNTASVWINAGGYRQATKQPWEDGAPAKEWIPFDPSWMKRKLCYNGSGQSWAKPTQEEAIRSLAIRLTRWAANIHREKLRALDACKALENLRPDLADFAEEARNTINATDTNREECPWN